MNGDVDEQVNLLIVATALRLRILAGLGRYDEFEEAVRVVYQTGLAMGKSRS